MFSIKLNRRIREPYVRWCGRSTSQLTASHLPDHLQEKIQDWIFQLPNYTNSQPSSKTEHYPPTSQTPSFHKTHEPAQH